MAPPPPSVSESIFGAWTTIGVRFASREEDRPLIAKQAEQHPAAPDFSRLRMAIPSVQRCVSKVSV